MPIKKARITPGFFYLFRRITKVYSTPFGALEGSSKS